MSDEIRVHIDTLEYTREGLKTREAIPLQVGQHNRIVLVRPDRVAPSRVGLGGFMLNSSFPVPPVLLLGLSVALDELFDRFQQHPAATCSRSTDTPTRPVKTT